MTSEVAKAINDLSKRMFEMEVKLESFLVNKIDNDVSKVTNTISPEWGNNKVYDVDECCSYNGSLWKCKVKHRGIEPSAGVFWESSSIASELATIVNNVEEE